MIALALDFDGVVSDSAPEAFAVAAQTYGELRPRSSLAARGLPRGAPTDWNPSVVEASPLYRAFLEIMPLGNRAEDFGVGLAALEAGVEFEGQDDYDAFRGVQAPEFLADFHRRFYDYRSAWCRLDPTGWQAWMKPFAPFVDLLLRRASEVRLAIVTAKDRASVGSLLAIYGVDALFPARYVLDKETGVSKRAHLELLRERLECGFEEIVFVDDKVNHLNDVSRLGVRCALATWGYNGAREVAEARRSGYAVLALDDVERQLFGPPA